MKKAIFIFAPDIEEYQKLRGLDPAFFQMPFRKNTNNPELIQDILESTPERVQELAMEFTRLFGGVDDGTSSKTVAQRIKDVINGQYH